MGELVIAGTAARRKKPRTTVPAPAGQPRPSDLLERDFTAVAPARRYHVCGYGRRFCLYRVCH
jgi:hypothetical protein